jgi:hypothetical protein
LAIAASLLKCFAAARHDLPIEETRLPGFQRKIALVAVIGDQTWEMSLSACFAGRCSEIDSIARLEQFSQQKMTSKGKKRKEQRTAFHEDIKIAVS